MGKNFLKDSNDLDTPILTPYTYNPLVVSVTSWYTVTIVCYKYKNIWRVHIYVYRKIMLRLGYD